MRKYLIIIFISLTFGIFADEEFMIGLNEINDKVYNVDLSSDQIYNKSILWIAENFKSAKNVIEYKDQDSKTIVGNGSAYTKWGYIFFSFSIQAKDGRYKIIYSDCGAGYSGHERYFSKQFTVKGERNTTFNLLNDLSQSLYDYLNKFSKKNEDDNW
ncbi:MAG: DUF4468 domain-containing protein [Spirochaetes bacterium]|nr:DUF4468 domain-containing protein [Spirochaetota bacterium]